MLINHLNDYNDSQTTPLLVLKMTHCLNCQQPIDKTDNYCANCGQPTDDQQQSFATVITNAGHELLDIDSRLARTLRGLLFKPGFVSAQYRDGKRVSYTPPLRMYLVTSVLMFFVMSILQTPIENNQVKVAVFLFPTGVLEQVPKLMFVSMPLYAILLQLWERQRHYLYNLVFAVHIHTFSYMILMLAVPLNLLVGTYPIISIVNALLVGYLFIYPLLAIKNFFQGSWFKSLLMALTTFVVYMSCIGLFFEVAFALVQGVDSTK